MSEPETDAPAGQQLTVRPQRQLVADIVPIFDSSRFEHYGRIAATMAVSTLVPETLRAGGRDVAIANIIQVVEFADRANYSPFAVAQCASVVHGKLMFEGKLVDAMLQTKLGIELNCYYTGKRGTDERRIYVTDAILTEEQYDALEPGEHPFGIKMIDGSIEEWKTFERNGAVKANWTSGPQSDIQLAYKGKRTWSRMFKPAVMLGVLTEDEVQDFDERRLEAPVQAASFADAPKPPRGRRKAGAGEPPNDAAEPEEPTHASQERADGAESVQDAEFEDAAADRPISEAAATETETAPPAAGEPASPASAEAAAPASPGPMDSSPQPAAENTGDGSIAPRDEAYILTTDEPGDDGKVQVYINGEPKARAKPDAKACPAAYDQHPGDAPEPEAAADFDETDAVDPVSDAIKAIRAAPTFVAGEDVMKDLAARPDFKALADERKRGVRLALWTRYGELLEEGLEGIEAHENFTLMRLFLEFGAKNAEEIGEQWTPFYRSTYRSANEGNQRAIMDLMVARKAALAAPA